MTRKIKEKFLISLIKMFKCTCDYFYLLIQPEPETYLKAEHNPLTLLLYCPHTVNLLIATEVE